MDQLPEELIKLITLQVDYYSLQHLKKSCKLFNTLANDKYYQIDKILMYRPDLANSIYQLDPKFITNVYELNIKGGKLYMYGEYNYDKMGDMTLIKGNVIQVSTGNDFIAIITNKHELWTLGNNSFGQLGLNHEESITNPTKVLIDQEVKYVACGFDFSALITVTGKLYTFGFNRSGQLGTGDTQNKSVPTPVKFSSEKVVQVSCGRNHTAFITDKGKLYTMGLGKSGRLGLGDDDDRYVPSQVLFPHNVKIIQVSCGPQRTVCVTDSGELYTFGFNYKSQLGLGKMGNRTIDTPVKISLTVKVVEVSCGDHHTGFITNDGEAYMYGEGFWGQLGTGDERDLSKPEKLIFANKIIQISCGGAHTALLTADNKAYTFGRNTRGQLGYSTGGANFMKTPTVVGMNKKVLSVYCGINCTAFITN